MKKLGKIEEVKLREIWKNEVHDFTPWLAENENLTLLSETIGLSLVNPRQEVSVGSFSADILCDVEESDKKVIIENQLEDSNHDHLGKTIVYASGLKASIIIWIVKRVRDEHASAIEWLNNHTDSDTSFFLLELKVVKIGDSLPAPQFEIIQQPNNFEKVTKMEKSDKTDTQQGRYNFWVQFADFLDKSDSKFTGKKPSYDHWKQFAIGSSKCHFNTLLLSNEKKYGVELYIDNDKNLFDKLSGNKEKIEKELQYPLVWSRLDDKKASRISTFREGLDINNNKGWENIDKDLLEMLENFKKVFKKYL